LFTTDAVLARHPRQNRINLSEAVRRAAAVLLALGKDLEARGMMDVIAVECRYQDRGVKERSHSLSTQVLGVAFRTNLAEHFIGRAGGERLTGPEDPDSPLFGQGCGASHRAQSDLLTGDLHFQ
jgi:hypothetical protein